jgi:hypothetical protein
MDILNVKAGDVVYVKEKTSNILDGWALPSKVFLTEGRGYTVLEVVTLEDSFSSKYLKIKDDLGNEELFSISGFEFNPKKLEEFLQNVRKKEIQNKTFCNVKVGDYVTPKKTHYFDHNREIWLTKGKKYKILDIDHKYISECEFNPFFKLKLDTGSEEKMSHIFFQPFEETEKTGIENKTGLENKPHLCCFDPHLEYEMGMGMRAGANKHGWNNHRNLTADSAQQILDSLKRHLNAFLRGEEKDAETETSHLACVGNNLNFLYRMTKQYGYEKVLENIYGEKK